MEVDKDAKNKKKQCQEAGGGRWCISVILGRMPGRAARCTAQGAEQPVPQRKAANALHARQPR